jgi:methyl-accepting chemotaxis protein
MKSWNLSLKGRILVIMGVLLLAQVVLITVAVHKSASLLGALENATNQELPATKNLILGDMMHDSLRAIVLGAFYADSIGDRNGLSDYKTEVELNSDKFITYFKNIDNLKISEATHKKLKEVNGEIAKYANLCQSIVDSLMKGDRIKAKSYLVQFNDQFELLETALGSLGDEVEQESKFKGDQGKDLVTFIIWIAGIGLLASLILCFFIYSWTKKSFDSILWRIKNISNLVSQSSQSLFGEAIKFKDSTVEQSAAIQESVSALSEMSSMIGQTGQNVKISIDTAMATNERSNEGKKIMEHLTHSMASIQKANGSLQEISWRFRLNPPRQFGSIPPDHFGPFRPANSVEWRPTDAVNVSI